MTHPKAKLSDLAIAAPIENPIRVDIIGFPPKTGALRQD
jgi:hypothetical protein